MNERGAGHRRAAWSRRGALSSDRIRELHAGWQVLRVAPGEIRTPGDLRDHHENRFRAATVPGTAASVFGCDAELGSTDHVWRTRFAADRAGASRVLLCCDGLATLAAVWLNGELVLTSTNMFEEHTIDVGDLLRDENELVIVCAALSPVLRERRPRGRWPVPLVTEKNLRFVRTTPLGHMPGFCPEVVPVGPWRSVRLVHQAGLGLERLVLTPRWSAGVVDLDVFARFARLGASEVTAAHLVLAGRGTALRCDREATQLAVAGGTTRRDLAAWWPHTHGTPALHDAHLELALRDGSTTTLELGGIGFRSTSLVDGDLDRFELRVNGERVFCRGGAFPPLDATRLHGDPGELEARLDMLRAAGANMLRVVGNFVYESDAFYRACDRRGLLVFQDFMFANMDYPVDDVEWLASVRREAEAFLERTGGRPCITLLCGNTEVQQQAAMMGLPASQWSNALFDDVLPELCTAFARGVPYAPSSPCGGELPFSVGTGLAHYYGVGGYRRPLHDVALARPRFAAECLAFANPPCDTTLEEWLGTTSEAPRRPDYEKRIPRDLGANWTFADVTDHYVRELLRDEPDALRRTDGARYLALARLAASEAMAHVFATLRRSDSGCSGALVWMLHDLHDSAGLGLVDARGRPKAPFRALARVWAPTALLGVDRGLDGAAFCVVHDAPTTLEADLVITLHRENGSVVEQCVRPLVLAPRSETLVGVEAALGHFVDSSHAFRFGAPSQTLIAARLVHRGAAEATRPIATAFHLPLGFESCFRNDPELAAEIVPLGAGRHEVRVSARRFACGVTLRADGWRADDDAFHVAPGQTHVVVLEPERPRDNAPPLTLRAANARAALTIPFPRPVPS